MKVFSKISLINELIVDKKISILKALADDKTIIGNTSDLNLTPEQVVSYLENFIEGLEGEYIQIVMYRNEKDPAPLRHYLKLSNNETTPGQKEPSPNNIVIGMLREMQELRLEMQQAEHKRQLEKITEELEKAKKQNTRTPNPIYEKLLNIGTEMLMKSKQPVANVAPVPVAATTPAQAQNKIGIFGTGEKEKFSELISRWKKVDADFVNTIEKIVKLAESNPDTYKMYKNMIV